MLLRGLNSGQGVAVSGEKGGMCDLSRTSEDGEIDAKHDIDSLLHEDRLSVVPSPTERQLSESDFITRQALKRAAEALGTGESLSLSSIVGGFDW